MRERRASGCYRSAPPRASESRSLLDVAAGGDCGAYDAAVLDVADILGPTGLVASAMPGYEDRPSQMVLAEAVDRVMRGGGRLMAEAGTGVGKSFAYLVPAILAAAERDERVVIATHTIALQEQLLGKDVPFLSGLLPLECSVVLAKGRGNYLCKRRLGLARRSGQKMLAGMGDDEQLERIATWADTAHEGSRQELDFVPDTRLWARVAAEAGNCLGRACAHYDGCFYQAGRRRLRNAQIIVANHAFLFADMALRQVGWNLLPDYKHLVIDEAHSVEDVAADYIGLRVTRAQVTFLLRQLATPQNKGLLFSVADSGRAVGAVADAREEAGAFFDEIGAWHDEARPPNHRITSPHLFSSRLRDALNTVGHELRQIAGNVDDQEVHKELTSRAARCDGIADELGSLLAMARIGHVYWAERDRSATTTWRCAARRSTSGPTSPRTCSERLKSLHADQRHADRGRRRRASRTSRGRLGVQDFQAPSTAAAPFDYADTVRDSWSMRRSPIPEHRRRV